MNLVTALKVNETEFTETYVYICVCAYTFIHTCLYTDESGGKSKNLRLIFKGISI